LLITINLWGDYFISFQYRVSNYKLSYFKFNCSKALSKVDSKKRFLFSLPCDSSVIKCCYKHKNEIMDFLLKNVVLYSRDKVNNFSLSNISTLTFLPQRFDIIIKNGIAYFYLKGDE